MPFTIKTTFSFAGLEQGWSEDFYWSQATSDLVVAELNVTPLAQKRAKLLSKDYMLTVVRNAIVINDLGVKVKRVTDLFEPRLPGIQTWASSSPNLTLMCVWQNANNNDSKKQYMRGIPAQIGDVGKTPDLSFSGWLTNFDSWRSAMITFASGWLKTVVSPGNTAVVNSYVYDPATGLTTFTLSAPGLTWPNGFGFKQRVHISLPGKTPLDGNIVVVPSAAVTCVTAEPIGVHPFLPGQLGFMQIRTPQLVTLAPIGGSGPTGSIHPQRIVTHKTGRPSYASRGRAPERAKW